MTAAGFRRRRRKVWKARCLECGHIFVTTEESTLFDQFNEHSVYEHPEIAKREEGVRFDDLTTEVRH